MIFLFIGIQGSVFLCMLGNAQPRTGGLSRERGTESERERESELYPSNCAEEERALHPETLKPEPMT